MDGFGAPVGTPDLPPMSGSSWSRVDSAQTTVNEVLPAGRGGWSVSRRGGGRIDGDGQDCYVVVGCVAGDFDDLVQQAL